LIPITAIKLPSAVTLGRAYDGGSRNLLQWTVGIQQQQRRLFMRKVEVRA